MTNAKSEFLEHTKNKNILCVFIEHEPDYDKRIPYVLPCGFTKEHFELFLQSLDFEYDSGYGGQELFGHIWYTNGTWSERGEYDGSEWWNFQTVPEIPKECAAKNKGTKRAHRPTTPACNAVK